MQRRKNSLNSLYKVTLFHGAIPEIFDEISTEIPGLVFNDDFTLNCDIRR